MRGQAQREERERHDWARGEQKVIKWQCLLLNMSLSLCLLPFQCSLLAIIRLLARRLVSTLCGHHPPLSSADDRSWNCTHASLAPDLTLGFVSGSMLIPHLFGCFWLLHLHRYGWHIVSDWLLKTLCRNVWCWYISTGDIAESSFTNFSYDGLSFDSVCSAMERFLCLSGPTLVQLIR